MTNPKVEQATFTPQSGPDKDQSIEVHFNPVSLNYSITNTLAQEGSGNDAKQYVSQSTGKLSMELIFDTTSDGQDVRTFTGKLARFMEPDEQKIPAVVLFEWGTYTFQGMVDSYKEVLDFFSPDGVPLRATVSLNMSRQDQVFAPTDSNGADNNQSPEPFVQPTTPGGVGGAFGLSLEIGIGGSGRLLAEANFQESLRFSTGASLSVGGSVELGAPVAFATGGAGGSLGLDIGLGGGISAGAGVGLSADFNVGVSGSASAGVSASAGAFAGLKTSIPKTKASAKFQADKLLTGPSSMGLATDSGASIQLGGKANIEGSSSLSADVGTNASLKSGLTFEGS